LLLHFEYHLLTRSFITQQQHAKMQLPILLLVTLTQLSLCSPIPKTSTSSSSVLSSLSGTTYNSISISSGTAGTAQTEAAALFSKIDMKNLAAVSASDLKIIKGVHDVAEDAETGAFNDAVDAASGDAATALQVRFTLRCLE
jgi:hypothetical protein